MSHQNLIPRFFNQHLRRKRQVPDRRSICINPRQREIISCSFLAQMSSHYLTCNNKYCHASLDKPSTSVIDSQLMSPHCFLFAHWEALCDFPSLFLLLHAVKTNPCWYPRNLGEHERERDLLSDLLDYSRKHIKFLPLASLFMRFSRAVVI